MPELNNKEVSAEERELDLFLIYAKKYRGLDLNSYRKSFLLRRFKARFRAKGANNFPEYLRVIKREPQEWNNLLNNLSINVSEFFRDPEVFIYFKEYCIPELIKKQKEKGMGIISCWSCGCSYGEEPYSLAIIFKEFLREKGEKIFIKIWGTDVDEDALRKAKEAQYAKPALNKVDKKILEDYFIPLPDDTYTVKDEIKKLVVFKKQNLLMDKPLNFMDAIFLRNVRIYFRQPQAEKVLMDIVGSLKKDGYLVLGKAETMPVALKQSFEPVSPANRIFKKILKGG